VESFTTLAFNVMAFTPIRTTNHRIVFRTSLSGKTHGHEIPCSRH